MVVVVYTYMTTAPFVINFITVLYPVIVKIIVNTVRFIGC